VINILLGLAELFGLGTWLVITVLAGTVSTSAAHQGAEPGAVGLVGPAGLVPFTLAVVCNGVGLWKAFRGSRRASLLWALAAFVLGLVPWALAIWALSAVHQHLTGG